jgi:hypothetical protein
MNDMNDMNELIEYLKSQGFVVYGPVKRSSYVFFTDAQEKHVGYAQLGFGEAFSFSTVHKPNLTTGTGFRAENAQEAFMTAPSWASEEQARSVRKYASFQDFKNKHWQELVAY